MLTEGIRELIECLEEKPKDGYISYTRKAKCDKHDEAWSCKSKLMEIYTIKGKQKFYRIIHVSKSL